jgi:REP element-mobilizing transposase RayT
LKGFGLYGFSIIYDHVNLIIRPSERYNISKIMQSLKRNVSRNLNIISGHTASFESPSAPHVGDTSLCRLRGRDERELPEKGIDELKARFATVYGNKNPYPKFRWQKSFYDHHIRFHDNIVRQEKDWDYHYNYTIYNHIKHGLPENWKYTSLNYPELIDSIE